jgi:hypothetical protein
MEDTMKKFMILFALLMLALTANSVYACCGSSWEAPPPPPPPKPDDGNVTPDIDIINGGVKINNVYNLSRTYTKDWTRPSVVNEYGTYTFSLIEGVLFYKVETSNGSIFMTRY